MVQKATKLVWKSKSFKSVMVSVFSPFSPSVYGLFWFFFCILELFFQSPAPMGSSCDVGKSKTFFSTSPPPVSSWSGQQLITYQRGSHSCVLSSTGLLLHSHPGIGPSGSCCGTQNNNIAPYGHGRGVPSGPVRCFSLGGDLSASCCGESDQR